MKRTPMTRTSLRFKCSERDCPDPTNEELHDLPPQCFQIPGHVCAGVPGQRPRRTHQHLPRRSAGGRTIAWWPCLAMHLACDNGDVIDGRRYGNELVDGRVRVYDREKPAETLLWVEPGAAE